MEIKKGKLIRWVDAKGFGFIKPESGKDDIFIHISALKGMSRKPIIGDLIHYQISSDSNGKIRAVNAKIEGVERVLALEPLKHKQKRDSPTPLPKRTYKKQTQTNRPPNSFNFLPIIMVIGIAVFIYSKASKEKISVDQIQVPTFETQQPKQEEQFQCEGKIWCSDMSSYDEAVFYLRNCPGTKIDGDGDGIPCESQF